MFKLIQYTILSFICLVLPICTIAEPLQTILDPTMHPIIWYLLESDTITSQDVGDFYVSTAGDNTNGLSWDTAKNTIAGGLSLITAENQTILVAKGTYPEYTLMQWDTARHGTILKGSKRQGSGSVVLLEGQPRALRIDRDNVVIDNFSLYADANHALQIIQQNTILNNVTFKRGSWRVYIQDTDSTSTTTFNNCIFRNDGESTSIQMTSSHAGNIIFNNCYFMSLPQNYARGTGTYTFNNCYIVLTNNIFFTVSGETSDSIFNNCYFFGAKGIAFDYLRNTIGAGASITLNTCFYQRVPNFAGDYDVDSTATINNSYSDILGLASRRRPIYVSLGIDDTQYFDGFEALVIEADARGVPASWHISPAEMTSQNWIDANAAVVNGHEIYSHGNVYTDYMGDLLAFTVEFTGVGAATIEVSSDTLTLREGGSPVKAIDLTTDTVTETMADINSTTDWSAAMVSATRHADNPGTQLADISATDATSEITLSLDSTYYSWVAVQSKANIEANMPGYTLDTFIYPQHGKSEDATTALQNAGFIGAGGVLGAAHWLFDTSNFDLYKISRVNVSQLDLTSTATLNRDISAIIETAGYYGGAIQFYSHGLSETTGAEWGRVIDALHSFGITITTYRDAIQYIRNTATITSNQLANFTWNDDNWLPQR